MPGTLASDSIVSGEWRISVPFITVEGVGLVFWPARRQTGSYHDARFRPAETGLAKNLNTPLPEETFWWGFRSPHSAAGRDHGILTQQMGNGVEVGAEFAGSSDSLVLVYWGEVLLSSGFLLSTVGRSGSESSRRVCTFEPGMSYTYRMTSGVSDRPLSMCRVSYNDRPSCDNSNVRLIFPPSGLFSSDTSRLPSQ